MLFKNTNPGGSFQANLALQNSSNFYCFGVPFLFFFLTCASVMQKKLLSSQAHQAFRDFAIHYIST